MSIRAKLFVWLMRLQWKDVLKTRSSCYFAIYCLIYLKKADSFPENTIKKNIEIAFDEVDRLIESTLASGNNDEASGIKNIPSVALDRAISDLLKTYFLIEAYYYQLGNGSVPTSSHYLDALQKAKSIDESAVPITDSEYKQLKKKITEKSKKLKSEISRVNKLRIEEKGRSEYPKLNINRNDISFIVGASSTLFAVSGFFYTKIYYESFGVDVSDFFLISDYLSVSIRELSSVAVSTMAAIISYSLGGRESIRRKIHSEQFNIENKNPIPAWVIYLIFLGSVTSFITPYLFEDRIVLQSLLPAAMISVLYVIHKVPLEDYCESPSAFRFMLVGISMLFMQLYFNAQNNIYMLTNLETDKYEINYEIMRDEKLIFIGQNSRFTFLLDVNSKKTIVVPVASIKSFVAPEK